MALGGSLPPLHISFILPPGVPVRGVWRRSPLPLPPVWGSAGPSPPHPGTAWPTLASPGFSLRVRSWGLGQSSGSPCRARLGSGWGGGRLPGASQGKDPSPAREGAREVAEGEEDKLQITSQNQQAPRPDLGSQLERSRVARLGTCLSLPARPPSQTHPSPQPWGGLGPLQNSCRSPWESSPPGRRSLPPRLSPPHKNE